MSAAVHRPSPQELRADALAELAGVGLGRGASALARLVGETLWVSVAELRPAAPVDKTRHVGLSFQVQGLGESPASLWVVLDGSSAERLVERMVGEEQAPDGALAQSALMEAGNVMVSSFLNAVSRLLSRVLIPSPPQAGAPKNTDASATRVRGRFYTPRGDIQGSVELALSEAQVMEILRAMGVEAVG